MTLPRALGIPVVLCIQHSPGWRWMPGMKHPAHILPGIAYLDHKSYMYDLVCFWCRMHGSNTMPDDDTSHLLVLFLFLWRLRGGLEPAAISRFLMKFFHMIEYLQVSMSIISKRTGRNLMILQKMISRFWWYSQVLCLNYECAHKLRHSLLGNTDIDIGINLVELYNTERPKLGSTVCVQWILPHGLYDDVPVYREGRRSVLPFQWYKHGCLKQLFPSRNWHHWLVYILWFIRMVCSGSISWYQLLIFTRGEVPRGWQPRGWTTEILRDAIPMLKLEAVVFSWVTSIL